MNDIEKEKILNLKNNGYGYKKIAKELSVPLPSVISIIKRNNDEIGVCKNCGIKIKSIKGKKKRIFCSDKCRMEWWNSHKDQVNKKALYTLTCQHCNKKFVSYGNDKRKYCSRECYTESRKGKGCNDHASN